MKPLLYKERICWICFLSAHDKINFYRKLLLTGVEHHSEIFLFSYWLIEPQHPWKGLWFHSFVFTSIHLSFNPFIQWDTRSIMIIHDSNISLHEKRSKPSGKILLMNHSHNRCWKVLTATLADSDRVSRVLEFPRMHVQLNDTELCRRARLQLEQSESQALDERRLRGPMHPGQACRRG